MPERRAQAKTRREFRRKENGSFGFLFPALTGWAKLCHAYGVRRAAAEAWANRERSSIKERARCFEFAQGKPAVRKRRVRRPQKKVKSLTSKEVSYIKCTAAAGPSSPSADGADFGMTR